jgi:hypothetical protein
MPQTSSAWDSKIDPTDERTVGGGAARDVRLRPPAAGFFGARFLAADWGRRRPAGTGGLRVLAVDRPVGRALARRRFVVTTMRTTVTAVPTAPEDRCRRPAQTMTTTGTIMGRRRVRSPTSLPNAFRA